MALDRNSSPKRLSGATGRCRSLPERLVGLIESLLARFANIVKHVIVEIEKRTTLALAIQNEKQMRDALADPPGACHERCA